MPCNPKLLFPWLTPFRPKGMIYAYHLPVLWKQKALHPSAMKVIVRDRHCFELQAEFEQQKSFYESKTNEKTCQSFFSFLQLKKVLFPSIVQCPNSAFFLYCNLWFWGYWCISKAFPIVVQWQTDILHLSIILTFIHM